MLMMLAVLERAAADAADAQFPVALCWHVRQLMLMMLAVSGLLLERVAADADDARCVGASVGMCGS